MNLLMNLPVDLPAESLAAARREPAQLQVHYAAGPLVGLLVVAPTLAQAATLEVGPTLEPQPPMKEATALGAASHLSLREQQGAVPKPTGR